MIGALTGRFVEAEDNLVLLDVAGVAYELEVTGAALSFLSDHVANHGSDTPCRIFSHLVTREDAQLLYGFASKSERDLFRALIRINGVGPKLALALLSGMSLSQLSQAVANQEVAVLTKIPGVGRKTAERLLVELKDKLPAQVLQLPTTSAVSVSMDSIESDAFDALLALGYRTNEIAPVLVRVRKEAPDSDTAECVRLALRHFYRRSEASS